MATIAKHPPQLVFLLDESGSMGGYENVTLAALNRFVDTVKGAQGMVEFTFATFQNTMQVIFDRVPLNEAPTIKHGIPLWLHGGEANRRSWERLPETTYSKPDRHGRVYPTSIGRGHYAPGGGNEIKKCSILMANRMEKLVGNDTKVIFVLQTDGGEGGQVGYWEPMQAMIRDRTKAGWSFLCLNLNMQGQTDAQLADIAKRDPRAYASLMDPANPRGNLGAQMGFARENVVNYTAAGSGSMEAFVAAANNTLGKLYGA